MVRNQRDETAVWSAVDNTIQFPHLADGTTPNGSGTVTISNVAPAGVGTATIALWLNIVIDGTVYYIPCWT